MNIFTRSLLLVTFVSFIGQEAHPVCYNYTTSDLIKIGVGSAAILGGGAWLYTKFFSSEAKLRRAGDILAEVKSKSLSNRTFNNSYEIYDFLNLRYGGSYNSYTTHNTHTHVAYYHNWFLVEGYNDFESISCTVLKGLKLVASVKDSPKFTDRKKYLKGELETILRNVSRLKSLILNHSSYQSQLVLYNDHCTKVALEVARQRRLNEEHRIQQERDDRWLRAVTGQKQSSVVVNNYTTPVVVIQPQVPPVPQATSVEEKSSLQKLVNNEQSEKQKVKKIYPETPEPAFNPFVD